MKIYLYDAGHITRMAYVSIYGKNLLKNQMADFDETWYVALGTTSYHRVFNGLTFIFLWQVVGFYV